MSNTIPALTGGGSIVGWAREAAWGTVPTTGEDPNKTFGSAEHPAHFAAVKEESFDPQVNAEPQMDDMAEDREVIRVVTNAPNYAGGIRLLAGPETIGWLLTMVFGSPETSQLAESSGGSDNDVYQHIWTPGANARAEWPAPFSIESRLDTVRSKLIQGALIQRLPIDIPNNGPMMCTPAMIAKAMQMITTGESGEADGEGVAKICGLTANPTLIDEEPWHFKHIKASPTIDAEAIDSVTSVSFEFAFPDLHGILTGGSGTSLGAYGVDKFQLTGRASILFQDEDLWYKAKSGDAFALVAELEGDTIQGNYKDYLKIEVFAAYASNPGLINRVGDLTYDLPWSAKRDVTEGISCRVTLKNSVASYAA